MNNFGNQYILLSLLKKMLNKILKYEFEPSLRKTGYPAICKLEY